MRECAEMQATHDAVSDDVSDLCAPFGQHPFSHRPCRRQTSAETALSSPDGHAQRNCFMLTADTRLVLCALIARAWLVPVWTDRSCFHVMNNSGPTTFVPPPAR